MQCIVKWDGSKQMDKDKGRGQNRNAKSVVKEEGGKQIAASIKQPPKKREKSGNLVFKLGWQNPNLGRLQYQPVFGPQVQEQHVATPHSFGVLVRKQTLRQLQKTVHTGMSLYQSVWEEIMYSLILIY